MEYSGSVRRSIKKHCRKQCASRLGACIGIHFLAVLPQILLTICMGGIVFFNMFSLFTAYDSDFTNMTAQQAMRVLSQVLGGVILPLTALIVICAIISGPLMYGLQKFYLSLQRGEYETVGILFQPFTSIRSFWTGIKMEFCIGFRAFIWMLLPWAAMMAIFAPLVFAVSDTQSDAVNYALLIGAVIAVLLLAILLFFISVKVQTYQAGWAIIDQNEHYGAWAATRDASRAFRGHYGSLVFFWLTFVGWSLLIGLLSNMPTILERFVDHWAIILIVSMAATILCVVISCFVAAYQMASFYGLFDFFARESQQDAMNMQQPIEQPTPEQPIEQPTQEQPIEQPTPEQPAEQPAPEQPTEQPAPEQPADSSAEDQKEE